MTSLTLPNSVKILVINYGFARCTRLTSLKLSHSLMYVDNKAFTNNYTALTSVFFRSSVVSRGTFIT